MSTILQDLTYALRTFRKRPGFTAIAILTLTLGIGANSAVFNLISTVVLAPLDYPQPDRLVKIGGIGKAFGGRAVNLSRPDFRDFARESHSFEALGAFDAVVGAVTITGFGEAERIRGVAVSGDFFRTLQTVPQLGRLIDPADDQKNINVGVISYGLWQRHFGGDPGVIGRTISIGNQSFPIIGVLPAGFRYPQPELQGDPEIYGPMASDPASQIRSSRNIRAIGRLKAAVTPAQAQAELATIAAELERQYPADNYRAGVAVQRLADAIVGDTKPVLLLMLGATLCVLLIGCANLANLLLARGLNRSKEIAIRAALGATRVRLVRQMLTESCILGVSGGLCAVLMGRWITAAVLVAGRNSLPRANEIHLDQRSLIFSVFLSIAASFLFGVVPALRLSKTGLEQSLKQGGRAVSSPSQRLSNVLVVAEVTLSMMLLAGAGMLVHSFWKLSHVDPGFAAEKLFTAQVSLPPSRYPQARRLEFFNELYGKLGRLPGVSGVAATNILPLSGSHSCDAILVDAHPAPLGQQPCAETRSVSDSYFQIMGIPLIRGREFDARDNELSGNVVLINQAMADWLWPGENPLGQTMTMISLGSSETPRQIIGIVGNTVHSSFSEPPVPQYYVPQSQPPGYQAMTLVIRATDPGSLANSLRRELSEMDPSIPLFNARTFDELRDASVASPRFRTMLFGTFGLVALALAMGGVYGVLAYTVNQRMHELGLRLCLGASKSDIAWLMMRQSMIPVGLGIALGLLGAVAGGHWIAASLYGVGSLDPWALGVMPVALLIASLAAVYGPVRRAIKCDPAIALREP